MRVPYSWLREYCAPDLSAEELAELLALRTTEVERISRVGPPGPMASWSAGCLGGTAPERRPAQRLRGRDG